MGTEPVTGTELRIEARRFDTPEVAAVIDRIQSFYLERYGSRDEDSTDPAQFAAPLGLFLLGYVGDAAVASGGWRRIGDGVAEVKRMWVADEVRGQGLARQMLAELERTAVADGIHRFALNTGYLQLEAMALYESSGYARTDERFGHYADFDGAHFFAKDLRSGS